MRMRRNIPLGIGMLLLSTSLIISRHADIPGYVYIPIMLAALALEVWGVILAARSPEMKNTALYRWKMKLLGRD